MSRTPDDFPGQRIDESILFDPTQRDDPTALPTMSGEMLYVSQSLSSSGGFYFDEEGIVRRLGVQKIVPGPGIVVTSSSYDTVTVTASGTGSLPLPDEMGQVLFAVTPAQFVQALPITSLTSGWLINNFGYLLVSSSH